MAVGDWLSGKPIPSHALFSCSLHRDNEQLRRKKMDLRTARYFFFWLLENSSSNLNFEAKLFEKGISIKRVISTVQLLLRPKCRLYPPMMTTILRTREERYLFTNFQYNYWYIRRLITNKQRKFRIGYENLRFPKWSSCFDVTWLSNLITIPDCWVQILVSVWHSDTRRLKIMQFIRTKGVD